MATRPPIDFAEPVEDVQGIEPWQRPVPQTSFLENFRATREEMQIVGNTDSLSRNRQEAFRPIIDALDAAGARWGDNRRFLNPEDLPSGETFAYNTTVPASEEMRRLIFEEVRRRRQTDPAFLQGIPDTPEEFVRQVNGRASERLSRIRGVQAGAGVTGTVGSFIGGVAGAFEDPVNFWTMPFGGASRTVMGAIGRAAVENMIIEAVSQPFISSNYAEIGEEMTFMDSARSVLFAGGAGAAFRGGIEAVGAGARSAGPLYDRFISSAFEAMPESIQQRWAGAATVDDTLLVDMLRASVPAENWTPEIRAAVNVIERDAEVRGLSPFDPGRVGDDAHADSLAAALDRIVSGAPPVSVRAPAGAASAPIVPRVPTGATPDFGRQWAAIIGIEGGTNRDGSFRTSPAGAIGPAQVMPGTAPEAARLAGIPFDERRYRTDAAYNIRLGQAYYREQLRVFGDPSMAAAAYNAGPGSARRGTGVRGAIARAERAGNPDNWEAYLPTETQQYVRNFRRRTGAERGAAVPEAQATARPEGDGGEADEMEALALSRGLAGEQPSTRPELARFEPVPTLRRDQFESNEQWTAAQRAVYRQYNDADPDAAPFADAYMRGERTPEMERFEAQNPGAVDAELRRRVEALEAREAQRDRPRSLLDFVAARGGIEDVEGDLTSMGLALQRGFARRGERKLLRNRSPRARRGIAEQQDFAPDRVFEAAIEAGYFPRIKAQIDSGEELTEGLSAFYEAIDNELRGRPLYTLADEPVAEARARAEQDRGLRELMDEIHDAAEAQWGTKLARDDEILARAAALSASRDFRGTLAEAWDEAGDLVYADLSRTALAESGDPVYRGGDDTRFEPEDFDVGPDDGRPGAQRPDAREGGEAAESVQVGSEELARFDDPGGDGIREQLDSLEHDLAADIANDPALANKTFIIEETGEESLDTILERLDGDRAAVDALRGCL